MNPARYSLAGFSFFTSCNACWSGAISRRACTSSEAVCAQRRMPAPASEGQVDSPSHSGVPVSLRLAIPPGFTSACMMFPSGPPGVRAVGSMRADPLSAILASHGSRLAQVHTIASAALPSRLDAGFAERCGRSL